MQEVNTCSKACHCQYNADEASAVNSFGKAKSHQDHETNNNNAIEVGSRDHKLWFLFCVAELVIKLKMRERKPLMPVHNISIKKPCIFYAGFKILLLIVHSEPFYGAAN